MHFFRNYLLIFFSSFSLMLTSCDDNDGVEKTNILIVNPESIHVDADKQSGAFTLETDADSWEIDNPASDWLTLSATSGTSAKAMISVIVDGKTPEVRSTTLTVHAGNATPAEITVTQASSDFLYTLETNYESISLNRTGQSASFKLSTTAPKWSIETDANWLEIDKTSGTESDETITISAGKNDTAEERNATITISAEYTPTVAISINQLAAYPSYNTSPLDPDMSGVEKTASQLAGNMIMGWNIGNSLEVPSGETGWGNAKTSQQLIDAVKAAGFNAIRIPCAWNSYSDPKTAEIKASWLARVKEVVDYCIDNDMYAIINSHWDGGWLEENPTYNKQDEVNLRHQAFWEQIATYFRDYDERLLFAGTNEVRAGYGAPSNENIVVQESYNQTFVDAVRSTGGKNAYRNLIVQTYNTNIEHGLNHFGFPEDEADNRLFLEVHYYDPYGFTLNTNINEACTQWGEPFTDVCDWGQEDHVDSQFGELKQRFVVKGVPIILGEYGAVRRSNLDGDEYDQHVAARNYFLEYVTGVALENGIIPFYWDNGHDGENGFALFNRSNGNIVDSGALEALMKGAGVIN